MRILTNFKNVLRIEAEGYNILIDRRVENAKINFLDSEYSNNEIILLFVH